MNPNNERHVTTSTEHVGTNCLGPPTHHRKYGESSWDCPYCGNDEGKFHSQAPKPGKKRCRFYCYACGILADAFDLLQHVHPTETRAQIFERLRLLRADWEKTPLLSAEGAASTWNNSPNLSYATIGGRTFRERIPEACNEYLAWARERGIDETDAMRCLFYADAIAKQNCAPFIGLVGECGKRRCEQLSDLRTLRPESDGVADGPRLIAPNMIGGITVLFFTEDYEKWERTAKGVLYCEAAGTKMAVFHHEEQFGYWFQYREYSREDSPRYYLTEQIAVNKLRCAIAGYDHWDGDDCEPSDDWAALVAANQQH